MIYSSAIIRGQSPCAASVYAVPTFCPADCAVQLGFFSNEEKREKLEHIDRAVDTLRQRYGYRSVQRAVVYTDPVLGSINAYDDHNIHPVGYFHTA